MSRKAVVGVGVATAMAIALCGPAGALAAEYFTAPFSETTHTPKFGQAPVFVPHTRPALVAFGKDFKEGAKNQVYIGRYDGKGPITCLTCTGPESGVDNVNGV